MIRAGLAVAFCLVAVPAAAQQFEPGNGCEAFLTVQSRGCYVINYWTCEGAPEGYVYRASHDVDGPAAASVVDAEGIWIQTLFNDGYREQTLYPMVDPISGSELTEWGMDSFDFNLLTNPGDPETAITQTRVRGVDILTGDAATIDGEALFKTTYVVAYSGADEKLWGLARGQQFYSPSMKMLFLGVEEWIENGNATTQDNTPVAFIRPGEPGFGSNQPTQDCGGEPKVKDDTGAKPQSN